MARLRTEAVAVAVADTPERAATAHQDLDRRSPTSRQSNRTPARKAAESTVSSEWTPATSPTTPKSTTRRRPNSSTARQDHRNSTNRNRGHSSNTSSRSTSSSSRAPTMAATIAAVMARNRMDHRRPSSTKCERQLTRSPLVTTRRMKFIE